MNCQVLFEQQQAAFGFTHRFVLTHEDLTETATATAQTIALMTARPGTFVDRAAMVLKKPFKDVSDTAFNSNTLLVGDSGDTDRYFASNTGGTGIQLNENGTEVLYHINPVAASTAGLATAPFMVTSDTVINAIVGSTSGKALSDIDEGEVHIYLHVVDLAALSNS